VKTLLKSVHIYQSYCKKNLAQFFLAHPVDAWMDRRYNPTQWTGDGLVDMVRFAETDIDASFMKLPTLKKKKIYFTKPIQHNT